MESNAKKYFQEWTDRGAAALDATHHCGERGPKTFQARARVAAAIDAGVRPSVADVRWLESVAKKEPRASL
jgi:hypothetical protein